MGKLQRAYANFFDLIVVNESWEDTYIKIMNGLDDVENEPSWVPAKWVYSQGLNYCKRNLKVNIFTLFGTVKCWQAIQCNTILLQCELRQTVKINLFLSTI